MKRTSWIGLGLLVAAVAAPFNSLSFQKPDRPLLPDFDKRLQGLPFGAAEKQPDAVAKLGARVSNVKVERDPLLGTPRFVGSTSGFLTGPKGAGRGVSPEVAARFSADDPHRSVKAFLDENAVLFGGGAEILSDASVARENVTAHNGLRTVVWQQKLDGLPVFESVLIGNITKNGELVNISSHFIGSLKQAVNRDIPNHAARAASPEISAAQAIANAAANLGDDLPAGRLVSSGVRGDGGAYLEFKGGRGPSYARQVWLPTGGDKVRLAWEVYLSKLTQPDHYQVLVDAGTGEVLLRRSRTLYLSPATYNVFTSDSPSPFSPGWPTPVTTQPPLSSRVLVTIDAASTNASPNGWIDDNNNTTTGNNVDAFVDRDFDQVPDGPRPVGNPARVFDFPWNSASSPLVNSNAANIQLFYLLNWYHDKLYDMGFTESAGNYQANNFGRGGLANDNIIGYVQAGANVGQTDNSFFVPAPDGINGQVFMFEFTGPNPHRDGSMDAEVVLHEITHGTSERLVGGGVGITALQPSGMGEGWSDFYALSMLSESTDDPNAAYAMGGYATYQFVGFTTLANYYYGIRHYPYSTDMSKNPFTFKDIDPNQISAHAGVPLSPLYSPFSTGEASEVHHQGEVWCATLWDVRANLVAKHGFAGSQIMLQLVTDGMKLAPPNPTFLEARDAIIQADLVDNAGANFLELWRGFAKRGMGSSAVAPPSFTTTGVVEAYDLPGLSVASYTIDDFGRGNGNGIIDANECFDLSLILTNNNILTATNVSLSVLTVTPGVTVVVGSAAYPDLPFATTGTNFIPLRLYTADSFTCGTPIDLVVRLTSTQDTRTNTVHILTGTAGTPVRFDRNVAVVIPDANSGGVFSPMNVSGINNSLYDVSVSLYITHTFDSDLTITLVAPDGTTVLLADQLGGSGDNFGLSCSPDSARTTFSDSASTPITSGSAPFLGTFQPEGALSVFKGKTGSAINGVWQLHIVDSFSLDVGTLQCWSLTLTPSTCIQGPGPCPVASVADLQVVQSATPNPFFSSFPLNFTVIATNAGPAGATNVLMTNSLPVNATLISATVNQGTVTNTGTNLLVNFGSIPDLGAGILSLSFQPNNTAPITNTAAGASALVDPNPFNNSSTLIVSSGVGIGVGINDLSILEGNSGTNYINLTATLSQSSAQTVSVQYAVVNRTASSGSDFVATNGTLIFPPGITSRPVYVGIIGDTQNEADETLAVNLFNPSVNAVLAKATGVITILNDDPLPTISIANGSQAEGNAGTNFVAMNVSLSAASGRLVTVNYSTALDTRGGANPASVGTDYGASSGVLNFAPGVTNRTINVPIYGDTLFEFDETFLVNLSGAVNATIAVSQGVATIVNDDAQPQFTIDDVSITEGNAGQTNLLVFTVSLYPPSGVTNSVDYLSQESAATDTLNSGDDYTGVAGTLFFPPGITNRTISVPIIGDTNVEANEDFYVLLYNAVNAGISKVKGTGLIINDDGPVLSINDVTVYEGNSGATNAQFTVTLQPPSTDTVYVFFETQDDTATLADSDYQYQFDLLVFAPGETNQTISITVNGDTKPEASERFFVNLFGEQFATVARSQGIGTIKDDDMLADLAVSTTPSVAPYFINYPLTYSIEVTNKANTNYFGATNVVVTFTNSIGTNLNFGAVVASQGTFTNQNGLFTWNVGILTNGGNAKLGLTATPQVAANTLATIAITADQPDPDTSNNTNYVAANVVVPTTVIQGVSALLTGEGIAPANGAIDAGETVFIDVTIANQGTLTTTNLMATLLTQDGVLALSDAQNYGALVNGSTATHTFAFLANGTNGQVITATFALNDGGVDRGTISFNFTLSSEVVGANNTQVGLPDRGPSTNQYPSIINISGVSGTIDRVTVTLTNITHAFTPDLDVLLVGPGGQSVILMSDVGSGSSLNSVTLTFADAAAGFLPQNGAIVSGTYKPTNVGTGDVFSNAPAGPYGSAMSVFNGTTANGAWSLYVVDDATGDAGYVGGWSIDIHTVVPVNPVASLNLKVTDAPDPVRVGSNLVYTITVSNAGPATASSIIVSNALAPEVSYVSSGLAVSSGTGTSADPLVFGLGSLPAGSSTSFTLMVTANGAGMISNFTGVSAIQGDALMSDNAVATLTRVDRVFLFVSPTPSVVTNGLPNLILNGQGGLTYVVEASTNLVDWVPILTNTTFTGTISFIDPKATNFTQRFYRAVEH